MARTRAADFDDKQQFILDMAADLFAANGFANTSINDIAKACNASKSRLYHYYASKEALLFAILSGHINEILTHTTEALEAVKDPKDRFRVFLIELMDLYSSSRSKHVVLLRDIGCLPEAEQAEIQRLERLMVRQVIELLTAINPARVDSATSAKIHAMLFYGMINWTYTWYDQGGPTSPREMAERIGDLFLHGFLSAPG